MSEAYVQITMRMEPVTALGTAIGPPVWIHGLARLDRDDDGYPSPPVHQISWIADSSDRYYTVSTEEPS